MKKSTEIVSDQTPASLSRRDILKSAAAGLVFLLPLASVHADTPPDQWKSVGKSEDFVTGQPKRIALDDGSVLYLTRLSTDSIAAVSAKCTHRGCEVGWKTEDGQFHCPCHGAVFASAGKNIHGTRRSPDELLPNLPSLPTRLKDGQVQVNFGSVAPEDIHPQAGA